MGISNASTRSLASETLKSPTILNEFTVHRLTSLVDDFDVIVGLILQIKQINITNKMIFLI